MEIQKDTWVWVVVQDPGENEMFLGQHYDDSGTSFIPAFTEKEEAKSCLENLVKDKDKKYEVQAIQYGLLSRHCAENSFMIFILNSDGEVLDRRSV